MLPPISFRKCFNICFLSDLETYIILKFFNMWTSKHIRLAIYLEDINYICFSDWYLHTTTFITNLNVKKK